MFRKNKKDRKDIVKPGRRHIDSNREIGFITYLFIAIFLVMLGYLGYFTQVKSKNVINNTYNKGRRFLSQDWYVVIFSQGKVIYLQPQSRIMTADITEINPTVIPLPI